MSVYLWNGERYVVSGENQANNITLGTMITAEHLCPDLLRYEQIGAADNLRGRVVRAFFWVMRVWPV